MKAAPRWQTMTMWFSSFVTGHTNPSPYVP
jgi:hypothetical protein